MKTIQELYNEFMANDELKTAFLNAAKEGKVADFIKANGCDATEEDLKALFREKKAQAAELSLDDMDAVAGGAGGSSTAKNTADIVLSFTILLYCWEELIRTVITTDPNDRDEAKKGYIC